MFVSILPLSVAVLALLVWGSASIRSGFYLHALCCGSQNERSVALTFDDGPDPQHTPQVLDVLARHHVQATFFLIGEQAAAHPDLVRRIITEGHIVGNHTHRHSGLFPLWTARRMIEELRITEKIIHDITGRKPQLFRPPFGVTNPVIGRAVRRTGLTTIGWSIRSLDTVIRIPRKKILNCIVRQLYPGAVILLHDRCPNSAQLTEQLLEELNRLDYSVNTVEQMFGIQAYEN